MAHHDLVPGTADPYQVDTFGALLHSQFLQIGICAGLDHHFRDQRIMAMKHYVYVVFL